MVSDQQLTEEILYMYFSSPINPLQSCLFSHYAALVAETSLVCCEEPQISVYNQSRAGREMEGGERCGTTNSEWQTISTSSCSTHLSASCTSSFLPISKAHSIACCIDVKLKSRQKLLTCWPWRECGKLKVGLSCLTFLSFNTVLWFAMLMKIWRWNKVKKRHLYSLKNIHSVGKT